MCNDDKSEELLAPISSAASSSAPKGKRKGKGKGKGKGKERVRSEHPGVAAGRRQKLSTWTGLRLRLWGKWGAEIRVPRTREKMWIGTFTCPRQAALAYDAAAFCFYGESAPKARKINFPAAPRPEISESERLMLTVADVKKISEKHARDVDALLPPLDGSDAAAPEMPDLVVPATPVAVVDAPAAGAGGGPAPLHSPDEDDDLDQMISAIDIDAFQAELDAETFIVSEDEYTERSA